MASLLTIFRNHQEWASKPEGSRTAMEDAVREYVLQHLKTIGEGAGIIAASDLSELVEFINEPKDYPKNAWMLPFDVVAHFGGEPLAQGETRTGRIARTAQQFYNIARREIEKFKPLWEQQQGTATKQQPATNKKQYVSGGEWLSLLPESINTERVRHFIRKAVEREWITITPQGLRWEGVSSIGKKAQLAYFCGKIFGYNRKHDKAGCPYNAGNKVKYQDCGKLFGVTRLDRALIQAWDAIQPQAWREPIDRLFE